MIPQNNSQSYHRPTEDWTCTAEPGCGCPNGPTQDGSCVRQAGCQPAMEQGRWECKRPSNRGGACETGPDPTGNCCQQTTGCVPSRSLRQQRKIFVVGFVSLVTSFLLIGLWGPYRNEFLAPGGLSSSHARLWSEENAENRCIACHDAGASNPIDWLAGLFNSNSHVGQPQYQKCLSCHEKTISQDHALLVHNLPNEDLNRLTRQSLAKYDGGKRSDSTRLISSPVNHQGELACANCHREHHGSDHKLAALTDQQCQSCHANQFQSFELGHPEFSLTYSPQPKIVFDHLAHKNKYFVDAKRIFQCNSCHVGGVDNQVMELQPFDVACGSCHQSQIDSSLAEGLHLFRLPSIDIERLKELDIEVGEWPENASGEFDGVIPPLMKILLATDPTTITALDALGVEADLFDVDPGDRQQMEAIGVVAKAMKNLIVDLGAVDRAPLRRRIESLGSEATNLNHSQLMAYFDSEIFSVASQNWFPNYQSEKSQIAPPSAKTQPLANSQVQTLGISKASYQQMDQERNAAPIKQDDDLLHPNPLAESCLSASWPKSKSEQIRDATPDYSLGNDTQRENTSPDSSSIESKPDLEQIRRNLFSRPKQERPEPPKPNSAIGSKQKKQTGRFEAKSKKESTQSTSTDLLAPNPIASRNFDGELKKGQGGSTEAKKTNRKDQATDLLSPGKTTNGNVEHPSADRTVLVPGTFENKPGLKQTGNGLLPPAHPLPNGSVDGGNLVGPSLQLQPGPISFVRQPRSRYGSWSINEDSFTISYRPLGHADPFIKAMFDSAGKTGSLKSSKSFDAIKSFIANPASPGLCGSCHQVTSSSERLFQVNWTTEYRNPAFKGFTKFSHRPHLVQPGNRSCTTCHELITDSSTGNSQPEMPSQCRSDFEPLSKSNCAKCHNQRSNVQSCTQCHNYHISAPAVEPIRLK